jgi:hypothetical protein
MSAAIRIRRAFGKWPTDFYGSSSAFSFRIGSGPVPPYAEVPDIGAIRAEGPVILGDAKIQSSFARRNRDLSADERAFREEERNAERKGRRLLHIRWNKRGEVTSVEREIGGDQ